MSTDWRKYSTPEVSRSRARNPALNGVIGMPVVGIRRVPLAVNHTPQHGRDGRQPNRAHTDVVGEKDTESRLKLLRIAEWVIRPEQGS